MPKKIPTATTPGARLEALRGQSRDELAELARQAPGGRRASRELETWVDEIEQALLTPMRRRHIELT